MTMARRVRLAALAALLGGALVGCGSGPEVHVHRSGLVVVSESRDRVVPEQLRDAYAAYDQLTESYPDDFGFASPNIEDVTIRVGTTSARGRELLASFATGAQAIGLRAVAVPVTTSRREVEALRDELIGWSLDPRFADAGVRSTEVERSSGMVVLGVERLTPALAVALVDAHGTRAVVVREGDAGDSSHDMSIGWTGLRLRR